MADNARLKPGKKERDWMTDANEKPDGVDASVSSRCYASGWRPEAALKQVALDMVAIIFDASASIEDCAMAASTLVEAICPELMPQELEHKCPDCGSTDIQMFTSDLDQCKDCGSMIDPV